MDVAAKADRLNRRPQPEIVSLLDGRTEPKVFQWEGSADTYRGAFVKVNTKESERLMRKALSAEEFSALFRRNADNERLYRESEVRLDLAERMTEMRRAAGLSQQQLADRVGRKQPFIARLEKGAYDRCGLSTLRTFARAMGYDISASAMFVQGTAAHFSGNSSCSTLEASFEFFEQQSGRIASISLASWDRADLSNQSTPEASKTTKVTYSAA